MTPNLLDRMILAVAPSWGASRVRARALADAYYDAAKISRTRTLRGRSGSADKATKTTGPVLRELARNLERNHDLVRHGLDVLEANIVGSGLRPEPRVRTVAGEPATVLNARLADLWEDWIQRPEVTGELHYYRAQRLLCRTWLRDGEVFVQHVEGASAPIYHGTRVPYSIELIEPDYCPHGLDVAADVVVQGVKRNAWGRPLGYYMHKSHPGDNGLSALSTSDLRYIEASRIDHLKLVDRIRQSRGITVLASVLDRLDDIKEIEESERVAARAAAAMAVYVRKGTPDMFDASVSGEPREMELAPGSVFDLQPGEDMGTIASNRPNNQVVQFVDAMLRRAAGGMRVSYSSLSCDYNGTYSAQRQEMVEQHGVYGGLWSDFSEAHVRPTWRRFVRSAQAARLLDVGPFVDLTTLYDADISRPAMPWIDPAKETKSYRDLLDLGLESKSHIIRQRGRNPATVRQQIAEEEPDNEKLV